MINGYLAILLIIVISYVIGGIPFGFLIGKLYGIDIRKVGSGNIGMANVYRTLGPLPGIAVLILDASKGFFSAMLGYHLSQALGIPWDPSLSAILAGAAAVMGHNWSIFLGFKGGKGIATSAGVLAYISPLVLLIGFSTWFVVTALTGYSALGSLLGAGVGATLATLGLMGYDWAFKLFGNQPAYAWFVIIAALVALYRHKSNIARLIRGEENKLYLFKRSSNSQVKGEGDTN